MTDSKERKTGRKNKCLNRKQTIKFVDWLRGNIERINKSHLEADELIALIKDETGFDVSWQLVRQTAKDAELTLKIKRQDSARHSRIDETLGQMCVMLVDIANDLGEPSCIQPLVKLAAEQHLAENE